MTKTITTVLQIIVGGGQVFIPAIPGITPEWERFGHAILGVCTVAINVIAHNRNPDGTPAEIAYDKPRP